MSLRPKCTFNVWGAGSNEGKSIAETAAVLKAMDADVLALQEMRAESDACNAEACDASGASVAADLGEALGYHVFEQSNVNDALWANSILSRHPSVGALLQQLGADRTAFRLFIQRALQAQNNLIGYMNTEQVLIHPARRFGRC